MLQLEFWIIVNTTRIWFAVPCPRAKLKFRKLSPQAELRLLFTSETRKQLRQHREHLWQLSGIYYFAVGFIIDNES